MAETLKHQIKCEDDLWDKVKIHKITNKFKDLNEALIDLIKKGLEYKRGQVNPMTSTNPKKSIDVYSKEIKEAI